MLTNYFPDFYFNKVEEIPITLLIKNNIKGIIFDLDNTLTDCFNKVSPKLKGWIENLKSFNITPIILSNSIIHKRVKKIANDFNIHYIFNAKKPNSDGFHKALKVLNLEKENIVIVGDQVFTDIAGGKKVGIKTILVHPISFIEFPFILLKRIFEIPIIIAYKKSKKPR